MIRNESVKKLIVIVTLLLEAVVETAQWLEAFELQGVVGHGGQLDVEKVATLLVAHPGVFARLADHLIAQRVEHALVRHRLVVRLQARAADTATKAIQSLFSLLVRVIAAIYISHSTYVGIH